MHWFGKKKNDTTQHTIYTSDILYGTKDITVPPVAIKTEIKNARLIDPGDYDSCGFRLLHHPSQIKNWDDIAELENVHTLELVALAKELTGCDYVIAWPYILRSPELAKQHHHLLPTEVAHGDFAATFGEQLRAYYDEPHYSTLSDTTKKSVGTLEQAGLDRETFKAASRYTILQFWRNTGSPDMDYPLALCDTQSVPAEKIQTRVYEDFCGSGFTFESLRVNAPNPHHNYKWYTYPEMTTDELLVFRGLDTDLVKEEKPFWTPHAAFKNPYSTAQTPRRRSVEVRVTCVFT